MRTAICLLLGLLLAFSAVQAVERQSHRHAKSYSSDCHLENVSIDFEDGTICLTHEGRGSGTVEITEDHELYVNGRFIETNKGQRKLLAEYYNQAMEIVEDAEKIGLAGAEIGLVGAELGLRATAGVFKLLLTDYDEDDFERDIEWEAEELEAKAKKLEKHAERLEDRAEDLEDTADELNREIPELRRLRWF